MFSWLKCLFRKKAVKTPVEAPKKPILSTTPDYQRKLANASFKASQGPSLATNSSPDWLTPAFVYEMASRSNQQSRDIDDDWKGQGGSFDGGGASGNWDSDTRTACCSGSSDSGGSDSNSSSCDSSSGSQD